MIHRSSQNSSCSTEKTLENTSRGIGLQEAVDAEDDLSYGSSFSNRKSCEMENKSEKLAVSSLEPSKEDINESQQTHTKPSISNISENYQGVSKDESKTLQYLGPVINEKKSDDYLREIHGVSEVGVVLRDIKDSLALHSSHKFNLIGQTDGSQCLESILVSGSCSNQEYGFVIDADGLGGEVVRYERSTSKVERYSLRERPLTLKIMNQYSPLRPLSIKPHLTKMLQSDKKKTVVQHSVSGRRRKNPFSFSNQPGESSSMNLESSSKKRFYDWSSKQSSTSSSSSERLQYETSDEEVEPSMDVGRVENDVYEVERILASKRTGKGSLLYYIKWVGWPYRMSSWQRKQTFDNISELAKEYFDRKRALSYVLHRERNWETEKELSQLHSLIRWENEINSILLANGRQILYICNDIDHVRRRRNFKLAKSVFFYTKNKRIRPCYYHLYGLIVVECYDCQCSSDCPTKVIQNGRRYKVAIVRTKKCGWGLFALETIAAHSFVVEYVGEVLTVAEGNARPDKKYQFELDGYGEMKYVIDAKNYGNEAAFINHSCNPNLIAICARVERFDLSFHRIGLFSRRRIDRGEELTLNYFEGKLKENTVILPEEGSRKCFCGVSDCMGYWPRLSYNSVKDKSNVDEKENDPCTSKT
ncbi:unnamed protein product [Thelazia callipaeda]|uniref:Chromo domain-containing protein n=1 Tax=Thelazia callipaeda TaxID=103827 RepID=A0A0N5D9Z5_THECL|nr:unnamed protein product [Thelazia callipaeda]